MIVAQFVIATFGFAAIWLINCADPRTKRWGCVCGLIAQPAWFYATFIAGQWGIFALSFFYTAAWARGFYRDWIKR